MSKNWSKSGIFQGSQEIDVRDSQEEATSRAAYHSHILEEKHIDPSIEQSLKKIQELKAVNSQHRVAFEETKGGGGWLGLKQEEQQDMEKGMGWIDSAWTAQRMGEGLNRKRSEPLDPGRNIEKQLEGQHSVTISIEAQQLSGAEDEEGAKDGQKEFQRLILKSEKLEEENKLLREKLFIYNGLEDEKKRLVDQRGEEIQNLKDKVNQFKKKQDSLEEDKSEIERQLQQVDVKNAQLQTDLEKEQMKYSQCYQKGEKIEKALLQKQKEVQDMKTFLQSQLKKLAQQYQLKLSIFQSRTHNIQENLEKTATFVKEQVSASTNSIHQHVQNQLLINQKSLKQIKDNFDAREGTFKKKEDNFLNKCSQLKQQVEDTHQRCQQLQGQFIHQHQLKSSQLQAQHQRSKLFQGQLSKRETAAEDSLQLLRIIVSQLGQKCLMLEEGYIEGQMEVCRVKKDLATQANLLSLKHQQEVDRSQRLKGINQQLNDQVILLKDQREKVQKQLIQKYQSRLEEMNGQHQATLIQQREQFESEKGELQKQVRRMQQMQEAGEIISSKYILWLQEAVQAEKQAIAALKQKMQFQFDLKEQEKQQCESHLRATRKQVEELEGERDRLKAVEAQYQLDKSIFDQLLFTAQIRPPNNPLHFLIDFLNTTESRFYQKLIGLLVLSKQRVDEALSEAEGARNTILDQETSIKRLRQEKQQEREGKEECKLQLTVEKEKYKILQKRLEELLDGQRDQHAWEVQVEHYKSELKEKDQRNKSVILLQNDEFDSSDREVEIQLRRQLQESESELAKAKRQLNQTKLELKQAEDHAKGRERQLEKQIKDLNVATRRRGELESELLKKDSMVNQLQAQKEQLVLEIQQLHICSKKGEAQDNNLRMQQESLVAQYMQQIQQHIRANEEKQTAIDSHLQSIASLQATLALKSTRLQEAEQTINDLILQRTHLEGPKQEEAKIESIILEEQPASPASSPSNSIVLLQPPPEPRFFQDSSILRQCIASSEFFNATIQKFAGKSIIQTERLKGGITTMLVEKETLAWVFRAEESIFVAVSFPRKIRGALAVILVSLTRKKAAFPAAIDSPLIAVKKETLYWTFGNNELRYIMSQNNRKVVANESAKSRYFQGDVSLREDIVGSGKAEVKEFEAFVVKLSN